MSESRKANIGYIFLDEGTKDVEDKLNQWKQNHYVTLHGLRSYSSDYGIKISVMVELTEKGPS